jgi:hypothetical protein
MEVGVWNGKFVDTCENPLVDPEEGSLGLLGCPIPLIHGHSFTRCPFV